MPKAGEQKTREHFSKDHFDECLRESFEDMGTRRVVGEDDILDLMQRSRFLRFNHPRYTLEDAKQTSRELAIEACALVNMRKTGSSLREVE